MSVIHPWDLSISEVRKDTEMASGTINMSDKAISHYKNHSPFLVYTLSDYFIIAH